MQRIVVLLLFCFVAFSVYAQQFTLKGQILDDTGKPLAGANIMLRQLRSDIQFGQSSGSNGSFEIKNIAPGDYMLIVSFVGYQNFFKRITVSDRNLELEPVKLNLKDQNIEEVKVKGLLLRQELKGDTTVYNAEAFKVNPDATTEDLLKKIPGISIEGSTVKAGGEQVRKVLVDGKEFFGNDPMLAIKNLQADMVDKIEVFDRQSDQSQFTGFNDGNEERTINISTKRGVANGHFGRMYAGVGSNGRYEAGGNLNSFKESRRISVVGLFNNINQQNFSMDDITGSMSGQGQGQRRVIVGGGGGPGISGGFMGESLGGITRTNSLGINYSDLWGKKAEVTASYFFNHSDNKNNSNNLREYFETPDGFRIYDENNSSTRNNYNHRFNLRLTYTIDSLNSIIFTPRLSWQDNKSKSITMGSDYYDLVETIRSNNLLNSTNQGYSLSGDIMYRHKFIKSRRTVSLRVGTSSTFTNGESNSYSLSDYLNQLDNDLLINLFTENSGKSYGINSDLVFTEPISPKSMLMINYSPSITKSDGNREVFDLTLTGQAADLPVPSLSNSTVSDYIQHRGGLGYNFSSQNINLVAIVNYQDAVLNGEQFYPQYSTTQKSFNNILPSVIFRVKKDKTTNFRLFYRTNTNAPTINQLQDVVDISNTRSYSSGNRDLKQQYSHNLMFNLSTNNPEKSRTFFIMGGITSLTDYVASSSVIARQDSIVGDGILLPRGTQFNKPVNLNGYYSIRSFVSYGFPFKKIKSNINFNGGVNFLTRPGMYNYKNTFSDTYTFTGGVVIGSSIKPELDFTLSYNTGYNIIENSSAISENYNYYNHTTQFDFNWLFLKRFVFNNNVKHLYYTGLGEGFDQDFLLWNAGFGVKFLKNNQAELRLKVYDLLDQNKSVNRSIRDAYIETSTTEVLTRYTMLTFTYRLRGKGVPQRPNDQTPGAPQQRTFIYQGGEGPPPPGRMF